MENKVFILKIKDSCYGDILDTFLLFKPQKEKLEELQNLLDNRFEDNDWYYNKIYDYIKENFSLIAYEEEIIKY